MNTSAVSDPGLLSRLAEEAADLLFHLTVALFQRGLSLRSALEVLERRRRAK